MQDVKFNKFVVFVNALVPLAMLAWDAVWRQLGANPTEFAIRTTGFLTLIFLLITLSITPLRKLSGRNDLIKYRRMLGLFAFFYGALHLSIYFAVDRNLSLTSAAGDIVQRPFIAFGMAAFFLMIPLAVTSTNSMIKRLGGKRWQQLHKLTYLCAIGGVIHYYLIVKSDILMPLAFAAVLAALLGYRVYAANQKAAQTSVIPKQSKF
ncbi:MAG TPA: protein-methionine-sulfoxide reductase heme-binding subunit MsrQ [Pyrinomonadaceae bacterium]|nr:protein-methionine-sulfoxide reductase heme-binding subunit MsrQ [Pyrinomonadaceae bacterium]